MNTCVLDSFLGRFGTDKPMSNAFLASEWPNCGAKLRVTLQPPCRSLGPPGRQPSPDFIVQARVGTRLNSKLHGELPRFRHNKPVGPVMPFYPLLMVSLYCCSASTGTLL